LFDLLFGVEKKANQKEIRWILIILHSQHFSSFSRIIIF
jgi:hypothetical protein